jgi:hypothetical protein
LIPNSPTTCPLKERLRHVVVEIVWHSTPSGVPARACIAIISATSQPVSNISVYRDQAWWETHSQSGSSWSGMSELKFQSFPAPWQSTTTISVAPAALAPRTAALISSV